MGKDHNIYTNFSMLIDLLYASIALSISPSRESAMPSELNVGANCLCSEIDAEIERNADMFLKII